MLPISGRTNIDLKLQKGDFLVIPLPFSNPTLDSGLILGAAYFYAQTEEEKAQQPASVTGGAAMYSSNDSLAYGIGHQHYWDEDRWRFSGAFGEADLNLRLFAEDEFGNEQQGDWLLDARFFYSYISRMTWKDWYVGVVARYVDVDQQITFASPDQSIDERNAITSSGLGLTMEFDRRDMPFNSYTGNIFQAKALFNAKSLGGDEDYQSYGLTYNSYHQLAKSFVLAWQVEACKRSGNAPLWDSCRIELRGFAATDYMAKQSTYGQAEARWHATKRWGFVGFAGAGYLVDSLTESRERDLIPSYGVGVRFMILPAKRINLRLDYARSTDSSAIHFAVGEAF